MENTIKNRIITISGEPVSGKTTVINNLIEMLKNNGFEESKIHLISTGEMFREYFGKIIDFIKNEQNPEKLKELAKDRKIQKIINNSEYRKALENTIINVKKHNINLDDISKISQANNSEVFAEIRNVIDSLIDNGTKEKGKEINKEQRDGEVWIFDSRMAFDMIPEAFSVRLTTNSREAGRRLYEDSSRGEEDKYKSLEEAEREREERRIGEIRRYKERYGVNLEDENNYDLIIDTSYSNVEDVADTIFRCEEVYRQGKPFGKTWASPLTMLPCQTIGETALEQPWSVWTLDSLTEAIKKEGFYPEASIIIYKIDGINYISDGHHANFASIRAGKTLIPYVDKMNTQDGKERFKKGQIPVTRKTYLFDHEAIVEDSLRRVKGDNSITFSYNQIYPGIYEKVDKPINRGEDR